MHTDEPGLELSSDHDAIAWYFGDLLDDVARGAPVSAAQLLDGLVRLADARSSFEGLSEVPGAHRGADETVLTMPQDQWRKLVNTAELTDLEAAACREVHRRMAEALGVSPADGEVPLIRLDGSPAEGTDSATH